MTLTAYALDHLVINVSDVEASAAWYQAVLGMSRQDTEGAQGSGRRTSLHFGEQKINLRPVATSPEAWFTAGRPSSGGNDLCFLTTESPEAVVRRLEEIGVEIVRGPVGKVGARGPIRSVYCRDPDGSLIEIASYESDG